MRTYYKFSITASITLFFVLIASASIHATTYYSRASGNWNAATSWSTVTYGDPINAGTYPVIGDLVFVGDGHTILLTAASQCSGLTIGQGASGIVEYPNFGSITLSISGSLTLNTGGTIRYNYNNSRTHNLFVSSNITNNGAMNLFSDNNDVVNLVLNGAANSTVSGTGTYNLNITTISKANRSYYINIQSAAFLTAAPPSTTAPRMDMLKGTIICNTASVVTWCNPAMTSFTIPMDVILEVRTGNVTMLTNCDTLINSGKIYITGGNLTVGSTAGLKGILNRDAGSLDPEIEVTSGTLTTTGGISSYPGGGNPWVFKQSNGNVHVNSGTTGTDLIPFHIENAAGGQFAVTGGNIYIHKPSRTANTAEIDFGSSNVYHNVTDGHVYFGDAATAYTFDYMPYISYTYPHFEVAGAAGTRLHPKIAIASRMLSIKVNVGNAFDISTSASNATSTSISLTSTLDGLYAIYNDGIFEERIGSISLTAPAAQHIYSVAGEDRFYNLTVNNAAGVYLDNPTSIGGTLTLTNGIVHSDAVNLLTINAGAATTVATNTSYVSGPVKKIGNTAFTFPIGSANMYRSISISAPAVASDEFIAEYFYTTPDPTYDRSSHAISIDHISNMEYWSLQKSAGTSNVVVTLSWNNVSGGVTNLAEMTVAQWDGAIWQDHGNGGTTGSNLAGTITSSAPATTYGPFSLSSTNSGSNPLPVELASFRVSAENGANYIRWQTASEKNNDYFDVERSSNGQTFQKIETVNGAGNSTSLLNYSIVDRYAGSSTTCYRLKQVDNNGDFEYSEIKCVRNTAFTDIVISPTIINNENINIDFGETSFSKAEIIITDITGKVVYNEYVNSNNVTINNDDANIDMSGLYFIRLIADENVVHTGRLVVM